MSAEPSYRVFLSHNSEDKSSIDEIAKKLRKDGLRPFLDKWHLIPGSEFQEGLANAIDDSECTAVFFGSSGPGPWHHLEMQLALNKAARTRNDYRVIPVLLPGSDPSQISGFLELRVWVDFRSGLDDENAYRRLVAAVSGVAPKSVDGLEGLPDEPRPYRGLDRFEGKHHRFFFGRNEEIRRLIERLREDRFVVVVGGSGSGKSSFVRAGLCTDLAENCEPGIRDWQRITVVPAGDPLRAVANQIYRVAHRLDESLVPQDAVGWVDTQVKRFRSRNDGLSTLLATLFGNAAQPVMLFFDQFEEIFTHRVGSGMPDQPWRDTTACFAANLRALRTAGLDWLRVVVALRGDFVNQFVGEDFPDFRELMEQRQFWLAEMNQDELREAVVFPAQRRGAFFEKGLVKLILADMRHQTAALPLLEEALNAIWDLRSGPWLTHKAYEECRGVAGALAAKADRILRTFEHEDDRVIVRHVFVELVQLGEGTSDTRRRVPLSSLTPAAFDPERVAAVIERFARHPERLITRSSIEQVETAEITHEALIRHWGRLTTWLKQGRDDLRLLRRLAEAARHWVEQGRADGSLWRPPNLQLARILRKNKAHLWTSLQLKFYERSLLAERERRNQERRQRLADLEHERQLKNAEIEHERELKNVETKRANDQRTFTFVAGAVAAVAIGFAAVAIGLAFFTSYLHELAQKETNRATKLLVSSDIVLADAAESKNRSEDATIWTWQALVACPENDERRTALSRYLRSRCDTLPFSHRWFGREIPVAFSPDGTQIASGGDQSIAGIWDPRTGELLNAIEGSKDGISCLIFSHDGKTIASASGDRASVVRIHDASTGKVNTTLGELEQGPVLSLAFSRDGKQLVASNDYQTMLWDVDSRNSFELESRDYGRRGCVAIAPDATLALVASGRVARLFDLKKRRQLLLPFRHDDEIDFAVFSPDGKHFATVTRSTKTNARIWRADTGQEILRLDDHVSSIAFNSDGTWFVTGGNINDPVKLWNLATKTAVRDVYDQPLQTSGNVRNVTFDAKGQLLIAYDSNTAHAMDISTGEFRDGGVAVTEWLDAAFDTLGGHCLFMDRGEFLSFLSALELSQPHLPVHLQVQHLEKSALRTGVVDMIQQGHVIGFDMDHGKQIFDPIRIAAGIHPSEFGVSFDGTRLVLMPQYNRCVSLETKQTKQIRFEPIENPRDPVSAVAISSDGATCATGYNDGTVHVWKAATGERLIDPLSHQNEVSCVSFSSNGEWILVGGNKGVAQLWNLDTGLASTKIQQQNRIELVAFDDDASHFATLSDGTVHIWDRDRPEEPVVCEGSVNAREIAFNPDGSRLFMVDYGGLGAWDTKTGKKLTSTPGLASRVVAISSTGQHSVVTVDDSKVQVYPKRHSKMIEAPKNIGEYRISGDGSTVFYSQNSSAVLWDAKGAKTRLPVSDDFNIWSAGLSPSNAFAVVTGNACVDVWDVAQLQMSAKLPHDDRQVESTAFSADEQRLLVRYVKGMAAVLDINANKRIGDLFPFKNLAEINADGSRLIVDDEDGAVSIWDVGEHEVTGTISDSQGTIKSVVFSQDGTRVAFTIDDNNVEVRRAKDLAPIGTRLTYREKVQSVTFVPNHDWIITLTPFEFLGRATVRSIQSGDMIGRPVILKSLPGFVKNSGALVSVSSDGKLCATKSDTFEVQIWQVETGLPVSVPLLHPEKLLRPGEPMQEEIVSLDFSDDSKHLRVLTKTHEFLWRVPTLMPEDEDWVRMMVEYRTHSTIDDLGQVRKLRPAEVLSRRTQLREKYGPNWLVGSPGVTSR